MGGQFTRIIANGVVAALYGTFRAHVVIAGERIAAFSDDDGILAGADEVIDASGLVVLPGSVDLHGRFEDPGHTEREDFHTGTMAAAAGGVTGVFEHPLTIEVCSHHLLLDLDDLRRLGPFGRCAPALRDRALVMVPVVLDEAFHRRGMALDAFARLIAGRPAAAPSEPGSGT